MNPEELNNAIVRLARVSGPGSDAWRFQDEWAEWWNSNLARSLGVVGVPFYQGDLDRFAERYAELWEELSASERASVPEPDGVKLSDYVLRQQLDPIVSLSRSGGTKLWGTITVLAGLGIIAYATAKGLTD